MSSDWIEALGPLALATRLRRLSERLSHSVAEVYHNAGVPFEPRWCVVMHGLAEQESPISVTALAKALSLTHPAVNQLSKELEQKGYLKSVADPKDGRKRGLALTPEGKALAEQLRPLWAAINVSSEELLQEAHWPSMNGLKALETALQQKGYPMRVEAYQAKQNPSTAQPNETMQLLPFTPELAPHFERLNKAWIERFFKLEPIDLMMLEAPQQTIIAKGGHIFFLKVGEAIVGTYALYATEDASCFELAKMAVDEPFQGKGLGKIMLSQALHQAKSLGAKRMILGSNRQLKAAIALYKKMGFTEDAELAKRYTAYERADIAMSVNLEPALQPT
jgi:DNA-binding MarR family transcriptional regulator/GNAT superfamily N-acetyltransferase